MASEQTYPPFPVPRSLRVVRFWIDKLHMALNAFCISIAFVLKRVSQNTRLSRHNMCERKMLNDRCSSQYLGCKERNHLTNDTAIFDR